MKLTEVAAKVVAEKSAAMLRPTEGAAKGEYDVKPLFTGNKRGWVMFDAFTAGAVNAVATNISEANRAKLNALPLRKAINICWDLVK